MFLLQQLTKELYTASFRIMQNSKTVGMVQVQGTLWSIEAKVTVSIYGETYTMQRENILVPYGEKKKKWFRPYAVRKNGKIVGKIGQVNWKQSLFLTTSFLELQTEASRLQCYGISEGYKIHSCMYREEKQFAQAESSAKVCNGLYSYQIYGKTQKEILFSVLFCLYGYVNARFQPGEKAVSSYARTFSKTVDPYLLEKYDPEFIKKEGWL